MKTFFLCMFLLVTAAFAQMVVFDPSVHGETMLQRIQSAEQLIRMAILLRRTGDPSEFLNFPGRAGVIRNTLPAATSRSLEEIQRGVEGVKRIGYTANGLYRAVEETVVGPAGKAVLRPRDPFKPFESVASAVESYHEVLRDANERRREVLGQINETTAQIAGAATLAEVHKAQDVLTAQGHALQAIDKEIDAASQAVAVQTSLNSADRERQTIARRQDRELEFRESSQRLGRMLIPDTKPVVIPERSNR